MLRKLLKYEFKATARIFLPMFGILLLAAVINRVLPLIIPSKFQSPMIISMTLYVFILIGMFVVSLIVILQRFYKNLLTDEGYLSFTLPVPQWMHIVSKLILSVLWMYASVLVAIGSVFIIAYGKFITQENLAEAGRAISQFYQLPGTALLTFEVILAILVSSITSILMVYAAMSIGHLANDHRVLVSLGAYLGLSTVVQIISSITLLIPGIMGRLDQMSNRMNLGDIQGLMHGVMWYAVILSTLYGVGYFFISKIILTRKLNLE